MRLAPFGHTYILQFAWPINPLSPDKVSEHISVPLKFLSGDLNKIFNLVSEFGTASFLFSAGTAEQQFVGTTQLLAFISAHQEALLPKSDIVIAKVWLPVRVGQYPPVLLLMIIALGSDNHTY